MFKSKLIVTTAVILSLTATSQPMVSASEIHVDPTTSFCFCANDFSVSQMDDGIFITAVPSANIASVCYGDRTLKAGDALPAGALDQLTIETSCVTKQDTTIEYCTVTDGKVAELKSLKLSIFPKKNHAPTAKDSTFETYRNMENSGTLNASDPEDESLTYQLTEEPKRGSVELHNDGTFTYTPKKNKVGKDSFSFVATDPAGNHSETAKVSIKIKKPTDKETYEDMKNDPDQFAAMWLKEKDIFSGSEIAGHLCFSPDKEVTRGEFLVMVMKLVGADELQNSVSSGFADEASTPSWMQPYITTALSNGMISGTSTDEGAVFLPDDPMKTTEAAVMVQNILSLPTAVFSADEQDIIPAWAKGAYYAVTQAGIELELTDEDTLLTRRDAARLLYSMDTLIKDGTVPTFHWVQ